MTEAMETSGEDVNDKLLGLRRLLDVKYAPGGVELDEAGCRSLSQLTATLRQGLAGKKAKICVIAVVAHGGADKQRWVLSARRAKSASDYLCQDLASDIRAGNLEMMSWGAGEGNQWCKRVGLAKPADAIILAIIGNGENRG